MTRLNVLMRGGLLSSIACIIFSFSIFGCNTNTASSELVAVLDIPENVTVDAGTMEISFRIVAGMAPEQTDKLRTGTSMLPFLRVSYPAHTKSTSAGATRKNTWERL